MATRATARDFTYLVASSWLPGIWILFRLGGHGLGEAALYFAAGYLCFVSVYEIGYFVNDAWDAPRTEGGRARIRFAYGRVYVVSFVVLRIGIWAGLGTLFGWIGDLVWLAAFAALVVAFAEHNLIRPAAFRSASFFQLACLRFTVAIGSLHEEPKLDSISPTGGEIVKYDRRVSRSGQRTAGVRSNIARATCNEDVRH